MRSLSVFVRVHLWLALLAASAFAEVSHHIIQLRPAGDKLQVVETFIWKSEKPDVLRVFIPAGAGDSVNAGERKIAKSGKPGVYEIQLAAAPQDTPVQLGYELPNAKEFSGKSLYPDAPTRFLLPRGLKLGGKDVEAREAPQGMGGVVYAAKGATYTVAVEGAAEPEPAARDENEGPGIQPIPPRVYDQLYPILGITLAILALGFVLLYRRKAQ